MKKLLLLFMFIALFSCEKLPMNVEEKSSGNDSIKIEIKIIIPNFFEEVIEINN